MTTAAQQRLNELIANVSAKTRLATWHAFVADLQVPGDLMPGIMTGRSELLRIIPPRACTAEEFTVMVRLIAGLLDTNQALQAHAAALARLAEHLAGHLSGFQVTARNLMHVARFEPIGNDEETEA